MKVIACVEDRGGMTFNNRRVSRDRTVIADILADLKGKPLLAEEYSKILFSDFQCDVKFTDTLLEEAEENDTCFVERLDLSPHTEKITALTVYRWNRRYPWDKALDITPDACGLHLVSISELQGYSHEKITKEIYVK